MKKLIFFLFLLPFTTNAQVNLTNGLIAEWNFDDSTANDHYHNFNGTTLGKPTYIQGIKGAAIHLNGKSDWIKVLSRPGLNIGTKSNISISFWFKSDTQNVGLANPEALIAKTGGGSGNTDYMIFLENQGSGMKLKWGTGSSADSVAWMVVNNPTPHNWHHIVGILSDSTTASGTVYPKKLYIDGILIRNEVALQKADSIDTAALQIGSVFSNGDYKRHYFFGALDEIRFYNRILSTNEINNLYKTVYTGITDEQAKENIKITILPNPSTGIYAIEYPIAKYQYSIYNPDGKEVLKSFSNNSISHFDISKFSNGIYILRIESDLGLSTQKLILQK